jgi:predicted phosphodiesterase
MRVGLISDVHANRVALEAVLADLPDVDRLACAGDVVGYGPWPADCVDRLAGRDVPCIMGNHDRAVVQDTTFRFNHMAAAGVEYARERLGDAAMDWLSGLPATRRLCDGRLAVAHGHPSDPDRYTYPREFDDGLLDAASGSAGRPDALVLGHTHVQGHAVLDDGIVCNPGSVGQPRDGDPRAAYAVLDLERGTVEEHRVAYDIDAVCEAVEAAGLPERIGSRLRVGE